jgi:hypothetical protein
VPLAHRTHHTVVDVIRWSVLLGPRDVIFGEVHIEEEWTGECVGEAGSDRDRELAGGGIQITLQGDMHG